MKHTTSCKVSASLPSRGAWIEITRRTAKNRRQYVAPLTGSVDRNTNTAKKTKKINVAPLTGSVDRNIRRKGEDMEVKEVAPLAGSVDRNRNCAVLLP